MLTMWEYSKTEGAKHQRIRSWARRHKLVAMRRRGEWFFANFNNYLESPECGLDDEEALRYLRGDEEGGSE
jgi:hypothetical protein